MRLSLRDLKGSSLNGTLEFKTGWSGGEEAVVAAGGVMEGMIGMKVRLTIRSMADGVDLVQSMEAKLYIQEGKWFYHYQEPESEMGKISTVLRIEPGLIRLLRQGDIQSEQLFRAGQRMPGYYHMPHGRMELDTETEEIRIEMKDGLGAAEWSYGLYVSGEQTGFHRLRVEATAVEA